MSESAITEKCLLLSLKKRKDSFIEKLKALKNQNIITETDFEYWDKTRHLRNYFSHPENQTLFPPGISFGMLQTTTQKINELFI